MRPANPAFRASFVRERGRLEDRVELGSLFGAKLDTKIRSACARLPGFARIGESLLARDFGQGRELIHFCRDCPRPARPSGRPEGRAGSSGTRLSGARAHARGAAEDVRDRRTGWWGAHTLPAMAVIPASLIPGARPRTRSRGERRKTGRQGYGWAVVTPRYLR